MTDSENEETPPDEVIVLSDTEKRRLRLHAEAVYMAMKRIDDEKTDEAKQSFTQEDALTEKIEVEPVEEGDGEVLYRHRLSWVKLLNGSSLINIVLVAVISFVVFWLIEENLSKYISADIYERFSRLFSYIFPLVPFVITVWTIVDVVRKEWRGDLRNIILWFTERWTITTKVVKHEVNAKGWLLNMLGDIDDIVVKIPRSAIINPSIKENWVGEILGYATVNLSSAAEADPSFRNIQYMSHTKKIRQILGLKKEV